MASKKRQEMLNRGRGSSFQWRSVVLALILLCGGEIAGGDLPRSQELVALEPRDFDADRGSRAFGSAVFPTDSLLEKQDIVGEDGYEYDLFLLKKKKQKKKSTAGIDKSQPMTAIEFKRMRNLVVVESDGIIYCPIPKVASAEWKRALRWMVGVEDWKGTHSNLHRAGKNGLQRLTDWGPRDALAALHSDRFFKFVVVRDPAERLVSAFLNKCVTDGYMSGRLSQYGTPSCNYLKLMPELFPNVARASLTSHQRLRDLVEAAPEDVFHHFVGGIWRKMESVDDPCSINHHWRPQSCFCQLPRFLSEFHVIRFENMSAEATALADNIPYNGSPIEMLGEGANVTPSSANPFGRELGDGDQRIRGEDYDGIHEGGHETGDEGVRSRGVRGQGITVGVGGTRREEIRAFLTARFRNPKDEKRKVTGAADHLGAFLSTRVMSVVDKMYETDYKLLGDFLPPPRRATREQAQRAGDEAKGEGSN